MRLEKGTIHNSHSIATIYAKAFPDSVRFFFIKKKPERLLELLELTFNLVFLWGGQAVVAKDSQGQLLGYCLYSSAHAPHRAYGPSIATALKLLFRLSPREAFRLIRNQLLMFFSARRTTPKQCGARIISIAINPSFQARGLGTKLLRGALQHLPQETVSLNVRTDNPAGRRLYEKAGFVVCGTRRDLLGRWIMLERRPR